MAVYLGSNKVSYTCNLDGLDEYITKRIVGATSYAMVSTDFELSTYVDPSSGETQNYYTGILKNYAFNTVCLSNKTNDDIIILKFPKENELSADFLSGSEYCNDFLIRFEVLSTLPQINFVPQDTGLSLHLESSTSQAFSLVENSINIMSFTESKYCHYSCSKTTTYEQGVIS